MNTPIKMDNKQILNYMHTNDMTPSWIIPSLCSYCSVPYSDNFKGKYILLLIIMVIRNINIFLVGNSKM